MQFKPITEPTEKERLISSFAAVSLLTHLSRLNNPFLSAFLSLPVFHSATVTHFLLLWALQIPVRVCIWLMQLCWQSWPSAGQPHPSGGGVECAQGLDAYICLTDFSKLLHIFEGTICTSSVYKSRGFCCELSSLWLQVHVKLKAQLPQNPVLALLIHQPQMYVGQTEELSIGILQTGLKNYYVLTICSFPSQLNM